MGMEEIWIKESKHMAQRDVMSKLNGPLGPARPWKTIRSPVSFGRETYLLSLKRTSVDANRYWVGPCSKRSKR